MFKKQHIYKWQGPEQTYILTLCTPSTHPQSNKTNTALISKNAQFMGTVKGIQATSKVWHTKISCMPYVRLVFQFHLGCFCGGIGGGEHNNITKITQSVLILSYDKLKCMYTLTHIYQQWCSRVVLSPTTNIFLWFHIRLAKMCGYTCFFLIQNTISCGLRHSDFLRKQFMKWLH
jgi:hypothetical protein